MWTPRYSVKGTSSLVPLVPGLYIIYWIMQMLTCLSHKFVRHHWLIQQLDIIIALVRIVLASDQPFSKVYTSALEHAFVALNNMGMHCHAYRKYTRSLQNTDAFIIRTLSGSPMVFAIEGFHCIFHNIASCTNSAEGIYGIRKYHYMGDTGKRGIMEERNTGTTEKL